jgi:hypothetical protein
MNWNQGYLVICFDPSLDVMTKPGVYWVKNASGPNDAVYKVQEEEFKDIEDGYNSEEEKEVIRNLKWKVFKIKAPYFIFRFNDKKVRWFNDKNAFKLAAVNTTERDAAEFLGDIPSYMIIESVYNELKLLEKLTDKRIVLKRSWL